MTRTQDPPSFGDIRAVMQRPPSEVAWFRLCELLERWPDEDELDDQVVPYLASMLARWPDRFRVLPDRWLARWLEGSLGASARLIRRLFLGSKLESAEQLERFAEVEANVYLTELDVGWNQLRASDFEVLARADALAGLTHLSVRGNWPAGRGLEALWGAPMIAGLRSLDLASCNLEREVAVGIARAPLSELVHLDISRNRFGARELGQILAAPFVVGLRTLSVQGNFLGDEGVEVLCTDPGRLRALRALDLSDNDLTCRAVQRLAKSPLLSQLRELDLGSNDIRAQGARAIADAPHASGLIRLNLLGAPIGVEGVEALARSPHLAELRQLGLPRLGPRAAEALAQSLTLHDDIRSRWR